jgi:hypothetical protein
MSRGTVGQEGPTVAVDHVGASLLVRHSSDPEALVAAMTTMTTALTPEPNRLALVISPSVTSSSDYIDILQRVVGDQASDPEIGVRLVALGNLGDPATIERSYRRLANSVGREVIGPLGSLTISSDGGLAAAPTRDARGGWLRYADGATPRYEGAWAPVPEWARRLPPETARVRMRGAAAAYPVPAGYWILPHGVGPGGSGGASAIPAHARFMTVFIGGSPGGPLPWNEVVKSLAALPLSPQCRIVLLSQALVSSDDVARLRRWCAPSIVVGRGVTAWTDAGLAIVAVDPSGRLSFVPPHRPRPLDPHRREFTRRDGAFPAQPGPRDRRRPRESRAGTATPAGWSLLSSREPIGSVPATAGPIVEVETSVSSFLLRGRPVAPTELTALIELAALPRSRHLIIVTHGPAPAAADALFADLAKRLDRRIIASDQDASLSSHGVLYTTGRFRCWSPSAGVTAASIPLGDTLPGFAGTVGPYAGEAPRHEDSSSHHQKPPAPAAGPSVSSHLALAPHRTTTRYRPTRAAACDEADRIRLRQIFDHGRYDMYVRTAAQAWKAMSGDADSAPAPTVLTAMVALCGYCAGERRGVNRGLRGLGDISEVSAATVVAACVIYGLDDHPVVVGPVYATSLDTLDAGTYHTGDRLFEPGFVDVDLAPSTVDGPGTDYAIWSVAARHLGQLTRAERATALFPAGTSFLVLDVDDSRNRPQVLLLDLSHTPDALPGSARASPTAPPSGHEAATWLRESLHRAASESSPSTTSGALIGLDARGRFFVPVDADAPLGAHH